MRSLHRVFALLLGLSVAFTGGCPGDGGNGGLCGNGVIDDAEGEECDGEALGGQTCTALGFAGGSLGCNSECRYDTGSCEAGELCGDGVIEGAYGEDCDGEELGGQTCESLGFLGGALTCTSQCRFDTSSCEENPLCGNDDVETSVGEECDGDNLDGQTCGSLGHYGGDLACTASCMFDRSGCGGFCGNFVIDGAEVCDHVGLDGQTCETLGYYGGTLACEQDCQAFDESGCDGRCGDGVVDADDGEACDDGNTDDGDGCDATCQLETP